MRFYLFLGCVVIAAGVMTAPDILVSAERTTDTTDVSQVLKLLPKETPQPNYGAKVPAVITGKLMLHASGTASGLPGVSVSDGYSVVKTDAQGAYELKPNPDAVFINVTRPAGYDIQGDWYKPLAAEVNFELKPAVDDEREFIFIHVTDTHISKDPVALKGLSRFVEEANKLTPKPRFVVNSGDLLNLSKALLSSTANGRAGFQNYTGIMNHLTMPYYNVAGDHTDSVYRLDEFPRGDHRCAKPLFWEHLGPHFFSFEYGKIHFVSVDYCYHLGKRKLTVNGKKRDYPTLQVQPMHTAWMNQDLQQRSPGTYVVTTSEHDLTEYCPDFLKMAQQHDIRFQLLGDDHVVSEKTQPVSFRTGGALAGCWWNPKTEQLCPDLSPQGYLIYRVVGEEMDYFYKGLGQRIAIVSPRIGADWQGKTEVQAHLVQPLPGEYLEYSLNGTDWKPMRETGQPFYRKQYAVTVDSASLPDGHLNFQVRSNLATEIRDRQFVVANGAKPAGNWPDAILEFSVGARISNAKIKKTPTGSVQVLFNEEVVGSIPANTRKEYSFPINASQLHAANTLSFKFSDPADGMTLGSPVLKIGMNQLRDPRDTAVRKIKAAHWGTGAVDWGGYLVGDSPELVGNPFQRKQSRFCFVLSDAE